jgi:hypothetical protein
MSIPFGKHSPSSIHQQDDYELFQHITASWQSILATVKELEKRNLRIILVQRSGKVAFDHPPKEFSFKMEVR